MSIFLPAAAAVAQQQTQPATPQTSPVREHVILEQPRAPYTSAARQNGVEGIVKLSVTLLANGKVGNVSPQTYLPHGLTQQAINAAKGIRFTPRTINGKPVNVTVTIEYRYTLYYEDEDRDITTKVAILSRPKPEIDVATLKTGHIAVDVFFGSDGRISVFRFITTDLTSEQKAKVTEAVEKITFRPAVHKSGKKMNVTKVVAYEFK
ncbi:MAG: energy transducer TonB [Acidobacteria bacterium]|nr:energy transducer TonB [Acidobacteriota bacterium]